AKEGHRVPVGALGRDAESDGPDVLYLLARGALAEPLHEDVAVRGRCPELVDEARDIALARKLGEKDPPVLFELGDGEPEVWKVAPRVLAAPDLQVEHRYVGL